MSSVFKDSDLSIVKTSESNFENAKNLANAILSMKLAACVSFSEINSIYWWEGKLEESSEVELTIKTNLDLLSEVLKTIKDIHSYKLPEIICLKASANSEYNQWIKEVIN